MRRKGCQNAAWTRQILSLYVVTSILRLVEIVLTMLQAIVDTILEKREMLEEYFSLTISEDGLVQRLPQLLSGYTPNLDKLPLFLMRLGPQVCSGD